MKRPFIRFVLFHTSPKGTIGRGRDIVSWTSEMVILRFDKGPFTVQAFAQICFTQNIAQFQTIVLSLWVSRNSVNILAVQHLRETQVGAVPLSWRFRVKHLTRRALDDFFVEMISALRFRFRPELTVRLWKNYGLALNYDIPTESSIPCSSSTPSRFNE